MSITRTKLDAAAAGQEDVAGFEVAVDDACRMCRPQAVQDVDDHRDRFAPREPLALFQELGQVAAVQQLHRRAR